MNFLNTYGDLETPSPHAAATITTTTGGGLHSSGYEGAQTSAARTAFFAFPTNCRREMSSYTRKELLRKVRALDANLGIFGRIRSKIAQHAVGRGIFVQPFTRDKEWNAANRLRFEKRAENPLLYSAEETYDLYEDQRFAAEAFISDGESITALVNVEGRNCTQRFDPFEVDSPYAAATAAGLRWNDGVLVTALDAPRAYGIREMPTGYSYSGNVRAVPADSILHVFQHRRAHQGRGLTWFYSGINNGIDALDVIALEKGAAKLHSFLGLAVKKKAGDASAGGVTGQIKKILGTNGEPTKVTEQFAQGAAIAYLAADEGIELLNSDRPSPNLLAFLEFLYREIANGLGIPLEVVYNLAELGGATARAVLEDAQWLFDAVQDKIVMRHSRRYYLWDTANAMMRGELPVCKDPEWWAAAWRGPAKLTVDLGRTADAAVKLMRNGALSLNRYYEERAQDPQQEIQSHIDLLAWARGRCELAGVPYEQIFEPMPGASINVHAKPAE